MAKYTEAQKRAIKKYRAEKVEEYKLRFHKGEKARYQSAADAAGMSFNAFIIAAMDEKIERDGLLEEPPRDSEN